MQKPNAKIKIKIKDVILVNGVPALCVVKKHPYDDSAFSQLCKHGCLFINKKLFDDKILPYMEMHRLCGGCQRNSCLHSNEENSTYSPYPRRESEYTCFPMVGFGNDFGYPEIKWIKKSKHSRVAKDLLKKYIKYGRLSYCAKTNTANMFVDMDGKKSISK